MNQPFAGLKAFSTLFLRSAVGTAFLSAVADRLGLWGSFGQPNVAWDDYARFVAYTGKLNWFASVATIHGPRISWTEDSSHASRSSMTRFECL